MDSAWNEIAKKKQQIFYETMADRDWDCYQKNERQFLLRNIGHSLFGSPTEEPSECNHETGYNKKQLDCIEKIAETVQQQDKYVERENKDDTHVAFIFVILKLECKNDVELLPTPVFRVPKAGNNADGQGNIFIDSQCRVYMGWNNFLKYNKLPKCIYCYPRDGIYYGDQNDQVKVDFGSTPQSNFANRVKSGVDTLGSVVTAGSTIVSLAALTLPVATPFILASALTGVLAGTYGVGRCVESIVDRNKHCQSIGLKNAESRTEWISLSANAFGTVAAAISPVAALMASRGKIIGKAGCAVMTASQYGCVATNGIAILNISFDIHKKSKDGDLTSLEVFQLSSAILFFTNSIVNLNMTNPTMNGSQGKPETLKEFEANLQFNEDIKIKQRLVRNSHYASGETNTDSIVIKHLTTIIDNGKLALMHAHSALFSPIAINSFLTGLQSIGINIFPVCRYIITSPDILIVSLKLAEALNLHKTAVFINFLQFSKEFIEKLLIEMQSAYCEALNTARYCLGFNHLDFDKNYGIIGDRKQSFLNLISSLYSVGKKCLELREEFEKYLDTCRMNGVMESGVEDQLIMPETSELFPSDGCIKRDFAAEGKLLEKDIFKITEQIIGREASTLNAYINYYDDDSPTPVTIVVIMEHNAPDRVVLVMSNFRDNAVLAYQLI